jgi:hypothetical protein
MEPTDELQWSQQIFGGCELGDARRTQRLVDVGARMARQLGSSLSKSCRGDDAALLGGYRLMRNEAVQPEAISAGGFARVAEQAQKSTLLLALEDTTSISYEHAVAAELGVTSSKKDAKRKGFQAHSVLLLDAQSERTLGLIEQQHWCRDAASHGKKHTRKQRAYEEKESHKWESASTRTAERLGPAMARTLSVCDRESDVYEYLRYKRQHAQRFVLRAKVDRRVLNSELRLFEMLERDAAVLCGYCVQIPQRGGRKAREAKLLLRSATLELLPPAGSPAEYCPLTISVVLAEERDVPANAEPLRWVLLTTEAVSGAEEARQIVRYYELRWRIEEYHKAWKSGVGVERQRFQRVENLQRMLVITAFLAVRLLQLRESLATPAGEPEATCEAVLSADEWKVLWVSTKPKEPLPQTPPSARWAFYAIARLGGFTDTKRTGRPGWDTIWHGWFRLQERLEGYQLSKSVLAEL